MPRFSLVIPTLQRPDTFEHALTTLTSQRFDDFEIVVQNNGRDSATEAIVDRLGDDRIRHYCSDTILSMPENWEAALANTTGEFIAFIGDDDGLFPDACRLAAGIFDLTGAEIITWWPYCYYWPNFINPEMQNRLIAAVNYDVSVSLLPSSEQLRKFYRFSIDYSKLPMIYNSFVARPVIERIKANMGRYFFGISPDVASGIVNAAYTRQFALISRPLSITGLSGHSTGYNLMLSPPGWEAQGRAKRSLGSLKIDPRLPPEDNLQIMIASDMLLLADRIVVDGRKIEFDFRRFIQSMAAAINDRPGFYDATRDQIERLAHRYNVAMTEISVPSPIKSNPPLQFGATAYGGRQVRFVIDGRAIGLKSIVDATRLVEQLIPPINDVAAIDMLADNPSDGAVMKFGVPALFAIGGEGVPGLFSGWGEPEAWGTWSIAKRMQLRLYVRPRPRRPIGVEMAFRSFIHPTHQLIDVSCWIGQLELTKWRCDDPRSSIRRVTIPASAVGEDGSIDLELLVSEPRSPAEFGAGADTRLLGIGLEWICIAPKRRFTIRWKD